ncbi:MAG TPA: hypothetical protein VFT64_11870 [Rickettsiales bacterium]|nr:hypothetical protein [Rickettsiales bacterium]
MTLITGSFRNQAKAGTALSELLQTGFNKKDVSLIVADHADGATCTVPLRNKEVRPPTVTMSAWFGGALGTLIASLATIGKIMIPGFGLLTAIPVVTIIVGALVGAAEV